MYKENNDGTNASCVTFQHYYLNKMKKIDVYNPYEIT